MEDKIKKVMAAVFEISVDEITDESSPDNIESWDSLKHMNLIVALEEEFGVQFADEEIAEMLSIGIIIETLKEKGIK